MNREEFQAKAAALIYLCESPTERLLLRLVALPTPYTFVAVLLWTFACVVAGAWVF